jgi:hypothetical protein
MWQVDATSQRLQRSSVQDLHKFERGVVVGSRRQMRSIPSRWCKRRLIGFLLTAFHPLLVHGEVHASQVKTKRLGG